MAFSRRNLVLGVGGALALAATGGVWRVTRKPEAATTPWNEAKAAAPTDVRLDAFRHAILAPNPHNRQPWLIRLVGNDTALIQCDLDRRLPVTDPRDRQIVIGFGCFVALAEIAAAERGYRLEVTPFPEGMPTGRLDTRPVAKLRFLRDSTTIKDPLFASILQRRSIKQPFDTTRIPSETDVDALSKAAGTTVRFGVRREPAQVARLNAIAWAAWMTEAKTPAAHLESVNLMRIGAREIDANPDGISLKGPFIEALSATGQLDRASMLDPNGTGFKGGVDRYNRMIASTPAYLWLATETDTLLDAFVSGRAYVRAQLAATARGLSLHPVSQALQEFPEMQAHYNAVHGEIAQPKLQMLARLGYGPSAEPSPRWPLASRLIA